MECFWPSRRERENFLTLSSQLTVENRVLQRMLTTVVIVRVVIVND